MFFETILSLKVYGKLKVTRIIFMITTQPLYALHLLFLIKMIDSSLTYHT